MALTQIGKGGLGSTIGIGTNSPDRSLHVAGTEPSIVFEKTNESTDLKTFRIFMNSSSLQIGTVDDAFSAGVTAIEITRDNTDAITGINVRSEGGATTTSLQQGLAKVWIEMGSDYVADDSLNIASTSDDGTGKFGYTYTNNMSNASYAPTAGPTGGARNTTFLWIETTNLATSNAEASIGSCADGGTVALTDSSNAASIHGDLA